MKLLIVPILSAELTLPSLGKRGKSSALRICVFFLLFGKNLEFIDSPHNGTPSLFKRGGRGVSLRDTLCTVFKL
ncbi:MAG: hypothetical protein K8H86_04870 [Ignavibacteriaceae bacterium]|nr:hypothetical protein [Ignavibacteriaceae bacterium]